MKVFITKGLFLKGIQEAEAQLITGDLILYITDEHHMPGKRMAYGEGKEWHRTLGAAKDRAQTVVAKEISRLENKLSLLKKFKF